MDKGLGATKVFSLDDQSENKPSCERICIGVYFPT